MASKGPKGTGKPAAPKAPVRPKVESKPKVAAVAVEKKPVPVAVEAPVVPFVSPEPVAAVEAAPQVVEVLAEAPAVTVEAVVEAAEAAVEAVQPEAPAPAPEAFSETVTEAVETVVPAALKEDKIMETIETNVAKAQAFFADFNDRTKAAVEKSTKLAEEANEFAKGNLEAVVESGKITAAGLQSFGQDAADYSRKSFEAATAALKSMSAVKSPTELFKLQSDFFRTSFDSYVAEASKTTEALIKLAGDAAQPLSSRVALAAEKAKLAA
jgi:phasin family protein